MKYSPWYSGKIKPARKGVYQRNTDFGERLNFSFWTGKQWGLISDTPSEAKHWKDEESCAQFSTWRGLAEKPK